MVGGDRVYGQTAGPAHDRFAYHLTPVTKNQKYVNMTDVSFTPPVDHVVATESPPRVAPPFDLIELLFFAYRDFVGDADAVLAEFGFGRAHHRVLHFINRNPGMKVAELLDILKITKQSLGRVLKQLLDEGYVEQKEGATDRRQRLLFLTAKGDGLASRLAGLQAARISRALADLGAADRATVRRFLVAMLDPDQRDGVVRLIDGAGRTRRG
jgi:DNA-binding MarR family transcriptional regulator